MPPNTARSPCLRVGWRSSGRCRLRPPRSRLLLDWSEHGGPPVQEPERRGFGRSLIERSVAYELDGSAELTFAPAGVRCHIEVPLGAPAAQA